jgi:tRNA-dihydrouridine synthase B
MLIGSIPLAVPFCQAGLEGYSDVPMRVVARRRGCVYALTEAMSDEMVALGGNHVRRRLAVRDDDHPLAGQLMGAEPEMMGRAAQVLVSIGYDAVDVNLACPVRKQTRLRGGHLLTRPETAIAMLRAVRDAVPASVPVTVKLRRGTDDAPGAAERFHEVFAAVWEIGFDAACVHGRTVEQIYRGNADWEFLAALKRAYPRRTILGSGDLFTAADALRMIDQTGVDGVWLARGAIGNPWIFAEAAALWKDRSAPLSPPSVKDQHAALSEHLALTLETYPREKVGGRMKGALIRYARFHPQGEQVRLAALASHNLGDIESLLARWYSDAAECAAA